MKHVVNKWNASSKYPIAESLLNADVCRWRRNQYFLLLPNNMDNFQHMLVFREDSLDSRSWCLIWWNRQFICQSSQSKITTIHCCIFVACDWTGLYWTVTWIGNYFAQLIEHNNNDCVPFQLSENSNSNSKFIWFVWNDWAQNMNTSVESFNRKKCTKSMCAL